MSADSTTTLYPEPIMIHMPLNQRPAERVTRVVVGMVLLFPGWQPWVGTAAAIVLWMLALLALFTGLTGWCPLYAVLGIGSRRPHHPDEDPS